MSRPAWPAWASAPTSWLWNTSRASVVSLVYFFKRALSPILAWMVHGEEIPGNMLAGILLILAGSFANIIPGILEIRRAKQQMPSN